MKPPRPGRDTELALRQQLLVLRSAELRAALGAELETWQTRLSWIERLQQGVVWLRAHPEWPAGVLVAAVVLRPRRALRWGLRLWSGWRLWRQLSPLIGAAGQLPKRI